MIYFKNYFFRNQIGIIEVINPPITFQTHLKEKEDPWLCLSLLGASVLAWGLDGLVLKRSVKSVF